MFFFKSLSRIEPLAQHFHLGAIQFVSNSIYLKHGIVSYVARIPTAEFHPSNIFSITLLISQQQTLQLSRPVETPNLLIPTQMPPPHKNVGHSLLICQLI